MKTAANEPLRYGKHGELLIDYEATEEHTIRKRSVAGQGGKPEVEHLNGAVRRQAEAGSGDSSVAEKSENNV